MNRLPARLVHPAYRVAYFLLLAWSLIARPHTRGVKCVLTHRDEVLLVRHSYGPGEWDLPGGFCRRGESFAAAARREIEEELGLRQVRWSDLGELRRRHHGRHETLHGFRGELGRREAAIDSHEVAELGWFRREALPTPVDPIVHAILALETWRSAAGSGL